MVVLLVLVWALSSPVWNVQDELESSPGGAGLASAGGGRAGPATSPPRQPYAASQHGQVAGRATGLVQRPKVTGGPPWGPAPRPPGLRLSRRDGA